MWDIDPFGSRKRLSDKLGEIMCDEARYQSVEFGQCLADINQLNSMLRDYGVDEGKLRRELDARPTARDRIAAQLKPLPDNVVELFPAGEEQPPMPPASAASAY